MKNIISCLVVLISTLLITPVSAQAPIIYNWARQTGGADYDQSGQTVVQTAGYSYHTGGFQGSITIGSTILTSLGSKDMFLAKYDIQGNLVWTRQANSQALPSTGSTAQGTGITVDGAGNIYVTGSFSGRVTFGSTVLNSPPSTVNTFVTKYNDQGIVLWARMAGGNSQTEPQSIVFDGNGHVVVVGYFRGTTSFGLNSIVSKGDADIFVAKLDASTGTTQWNQSAGGSQWDYASDVAIGSGNTIVVSGAFSAVADFGSVTVLSTGRTDGFITQIDELGAFQWVRVVGGTGNDSSVNLATDASGYIYNVGYFEGAGFFDAFNLVSQGSSDGFLVKWTSQGDAIWAQRVGGSDTDGSYNICVNSTGNIYVSGSFRGNSTFGNQSFTSRGGDDIFTVRYNQSGQIDWATQAGGTLNDYDTGLAANAANTIWLGGTFSGALLFGTSNLALTSRGRDDAFLCQLQDNVPTNVNIKKDTDFIDIYPNPVTEGMLSINWKFNNNNPTSVELLNVAGAEVNHDQYKVHGFINKYYKIDVHLMPPGIYIIRVSIDNLIYNRKVIIE